MCKRIRKNAARALFEQHKPVIIIPCKCRIGSAWFTGHEMVNDGSRGFDQFVNEFSYYNCNYETGYYPAFYTEVL